MFDISDFTGYPFDVVAWICVATVIGGVLIGHLTDAVMGDRGFGAIGNAILTILGAFVGIYVRTVFFGRLYSQDLMVTGIAAASAATALLLLLGLAKHFVQD